MKYMEIAIVSLSLIIIVLIVERFLFAKEMNRQLGEATRAVLSRNIGEFIAATKKPEKTTTTVQNEEMVELSELGDDDFNKAIGIAK